MRLFLLATAALIAVPASATTLFSENFNSITTNTLNIGPGNAITKAASMDVIGEVDAVVPVNGFGITATSTVIDLDGSSGPGAVIKSGFNLVAGRSYTLSFVAGGAQRGSASDSLYVQLLSSTSGDLSILSSTGLFSFVGGSIVGLNEAFAAGRPVTGSTPFTLSSFTLLANNNTSFGFKIGTNSGDNIGPLLDEVSLTRNAVPEPSSWAMLIAGFGLVGAARRNRRRALAA
jgi:PEP-CTERM motif